MVISNRSSVNIVRRTVDCTSKGPFYTFFFLKIDRWVGLAHGRQIYCFSPFLGVLLLFKVHNYWWIFVRLTTRVGIF